MKKTLVISMMALLMVLTIIPGKAYAADYSGSAHWGKSTSYTTKSTTYNHTTSNTKTSSKGFTVSGSAKGVSRQDMRDMKNFYRSDIQPYLPNRAPNNYSYNYRPSHTGFGSSSFSAPSFSAPSFSAPSFQTPSF
jgi:hypothetical protein